MQYYNTKDRDLSLFVYDRCHWLIREMSEFRVSLTYNKIMNDTMTHYQRIEETGRKDKDKIDESMDRE